MKKNFILLTALLLLLLVPLFSGCGKEAKAEPEQPQEPEETVCDFPTVAYALAERVEPTEKADGYEKYECPKCDDSYTHVLPRLCKENYTVTEEPAEKDGKEGTLIHYSSTEYGSYSVFVPTEEDPT